MKNVRFHPLVSRCKNTRFLCKWKGQFGAAIREGLSLQQTRWHLLEPLLVSSLLSYPSPRSWFTTTLWHNRSLSVTPGDRVPPIGLWPLPTHLIAGQSAHRSASRTQQESEMGQVQIYDPPSIQQPPPTPPPSDTPRALNQGRIGLSQSSEEKDSCAHSTDLCQASISWSI